MVWKIINIFPIHIASCKRSLSNFPFYFCMVEQRVGWIYALCISVLKASERPRGMGEKYKTSLLCSAHVSTDSVLGRTDISRLKHGEIK